MDCGETSAGMGVGYMGSVFYVEETWRVAQLVDRRIRDKKKIGGSNPACVRTEHNKKYFKKARVFPSQKRADSLSVCPTPVCTRTHKNNHVRTLKRPEFLMGKNPIGTTKCKKGKKEEEEEEKDG